MMHEFFSGKEAVVVTAPSEDTLELARTYFDNGMRLDLQASPRRVVAELVCGPAYVASSGVCRRALRWTRRADRTGVRGIGSNE
jgi:hypothetical protein